MQEAQQIRLEIPSAAEYVGVVRRAVEGIATRMRFTPEDVEDVKLAVGEACNNAVKHGCPNKNNPFIIITCKVTPDTLQVEVRNGLTSAKRCKLPVNAPDDESEDGRGLYIMKKVMDEVDISWHNRTASIRMVKKVK